MGWGGGRRDGGVALGWMELGVCCLLAMMAAGGVGRWCGRSGFVGGEIPRYIDGRAGRGCCGGSHGGFSSVILGSCDQKVPFRCWCAAGDSPGFSARDCRLF